MRCEYHKTISKAKGYARPQKSGADLQHIEGLDLIYMIAGKNIILVDDGIATGATVIASARWARKHHPSTLTIAVPVAALSICGGVRTGVRLCYCTAHAPRFRISWTVL